MALLTIPWSAFKWVARILTAPFLVTGGVCVSSIG